MRLGSGTMNLRVLGTGRAKELYESAPVFVLCLVSRKAEDFAQLSEGTGERVRIRKNHRVTPAARIRDFRIEALEHRPVEVRVVRPQFDSRIVESIQNALRKTVLRGQVDHGGRLFVEGVREENDLDAFRVAMRSGLDRRFAVSFDVKKESGHGSCGLLFLVRGCRPCSRRTNRCRRRRGQGSHPRWWTGDR